MTDSNKNWENSAIQFPRLLAEIMATQDKLDMESLANAMDLSVDEVSDLFDRADIAWESIKAGNLPINPYTAPSFRFRSEIDDGKSAHKSPRP